jgi:cell division protease FtsH
LIEHKDALDRIATALLEWETLDGEEVEVLIRGGVLNKTKPPPTVARPEVKRPEVKEKSKILDALGGLTAPVPKIDAGKA